MKNELIINGKQMELSGETTVGVTLQANQLGELQNRQGIFTNTFKILLTNHNKNVIEQSHIMTSNSEIPYRKLIATWKEEGIEIVSDGEARMKKADQMFMYIDVVGGNINFAVAVGDQIVGDLYESSDPVTWNFINVLNSRLQNDYYMFPVIDWRTDTNAFFTTPLLSPSQMLPVIRVPDLFDRVETLIGHTFVGDYLDSDAHKNMILTPSDFSLQDDTINAQAAASWRTPENQYQTLSNNVGNSEVLIPEGSGNVSLSMLPGHNQYDAGSGFFFTEYYPATNEVSNLRYRASVFVGWVALQNYGLYQTPEEKNCRIYARIWGWDTVGAPVLLASQIIGDYLTDPYSADPGLKPEGVFVVDIETGEIPLNGGWVYYPEIEYVYRRHGNADTKGFATALGSRFEKLPTKSLIYGNDLYFKDLFRMKVKDVFKDIINKRGILMQTDSYNKQIQLNFFQDLIKNKPIAPNWSKKVDKRVRALEYKFGKYGQVNNLLFKEQDGVEEKLGDYFFIIDDETLEAEIDAIQLNHPATEQEPRYLGYNVPTIEAVDNLNKWQKPGWRLLQLEVQDTDFNITYNDGTDSSVETDDIPFCKFEGFDILAPIYYDALQGILDRTKAISLMIKLNARDIANLDFAIPIYLDVTEINVQGYFYINRISNYKGGLTRVDLIRL